jgi:hypothetical protein
LMWLLSSDDDVIKMGDESANVCQWKQFFYISFVVKNGCSWYLLDFVALFWLISC